MKIKAAELHELSEGGRVIVNVNGMELGIFLVGGKYYAWRNVCPHAAAPVCVGVVQGTRLTSTVYDYQYGMDNQVLRCPWHGWEFDLTTGQHLAGGKVKLRGYPVEVDEMGIYVILNNSSVKRVEDDHDE
ncbi:Rieske (2Fe-2S) protein [Paenibacillus filicis]|uniref:Rieske (2Fe-2S) protein n=1 Tax=Paenibacillus gyeongsangnamensis TaxID=3388067 RepID=A0ABT4QL19_9BACL|nr:Rieske (2Fe-2S) protein [Paenibacillus filicis]MCZ8517569.1 Rieske (2Fe-2S) protein [Paenibacillus filicis]